ncbi:MAG TPA: pentapeptide repeat-containing protein [Trebonia sp.]
MPGINLAGCRLNHARLTGADLFRANLSRTEFVGADLTRANLSDADPYRADFTRATLSETLLGGAGLGWATFSGASLGRLLLRDLDLTDVEADSAALGDVPIPDGWERDPDTWRLRRAGGDGRRP